MPEVLLMDVLLDNGETADSVPMVMLEDGSLTNSVEISFPTVTVPPGHFRHPAAGQLPQEGEKLYFQHEVLTPQDFAERMEGLAMGENHIEADLLMADVLRQLGYGVGVERFLAMTRFYGTEDDGRNETT